ncbi:MULTISPECIES: PEP/pyruvate-binding domain-containing protein [unclassified Brevibacterium]|uniref:PEP/pyruvate-binding domain-containing protein n=1 Tax=unclassified Brevibacterium TaxID=2614124 RepID=UPI0010923D3F|nr:PEP/pyruvate-binding domain-containing protein [Brevibacterium sp. S22]TGD31259.1 pyruvate, phosphate dikinase [Brevibacterium sp. S22]
MLTVLAEATRKESGAKAAALGALLRAGFSVPDGFVVSGSGQSTGPAAETALRESVVRALEGSGDPVVAVRSSALDEDTVAASAAGQYESVIGVKGPDEVCRAIATCRASAHSMRAVEYRSRTGHLKSRSAEMAVILQPVIEADVSGVLFTPRAPGEPTRFEASWGLGLSVVAGEVTPDAYEVKSDGSIACSVGSKRTRIDLDHEWGRTVTSAVDADRQASRTLDDATAAALAELGEQIAEVVGEPQDVEWAIADGTVWILQSRPITAALPAARHHTASEQAGSLSGTPGSHGTVTAEARVVHGPSDFTSVRRGEILVCPFTDPAWTPLFGIAAGVITETGGALSHAAIVSREYGLPAVLGITDATRRIASGDRITMNGSVGTVIVTGDAPSDREQGRDSGRTHGHQVPLHRPSRRR